MVLTRRRTLEVQILVSWGTWEHEHGGQPLILPKSVAVRSKEGQRSLNARSVEKDIMDNA